MGFTERLSNSMANPRVSPNERFGILNNDHLFRYNAKVNRVIDGDTFEMIVDHGFGIYSIKTVRLIGCDTPEIKGRERPAGLYVRDIVEALLNERVVTIQSVKIDKSFDRYVFAVFFDGLSLTDELISRGLAWKTDDAGKVIGKRNLRSLRLPKGVFDAIEN